MSAISTDRGPARQRRRLRPLAEPSLPMPSRRQILRQGLWLGLVGTIGCSSSSTDSGRSSQPPRRESADISSTDPCAMRLHDLAGLLLLYYATYRQLPERIEALRQLPGQEQAELTCPVSGRPYVYERAGLPSPQPGARIVLYDPLPSHAGLRWAISIIQPQDGSPLVAKVIALPESCFLPQPAE